MVADWVDVSNHAYEKWKDRSPDGTRIGPLIAKREAELVPERFWEGEVYAEEVWIHIETMMLIIVDRDRYRDYDGRHYIKTVYDPGGSQWQEPIIEWAQEQFGAVRT